MRAYAVRPSSTIRGRTDISVENQRLGVLFIRARQLNTQLGRTLPRKFRDNETYRDIIVVDHRTTYVHT